MPHRSLFAIFTVALLMATLAAGDLYAQPGQDGGRRGGRGFGGPGAFGGRPAGSPLVGLLRIDEVRTELKVTEDQQELINILNDELREGRPEITGNFRQISDEDREKLNKWREEQTAQAKETLKTILDEGQYTRLQQIYIQTQGVNALVDDEVAQALKLSPEQVTQLKATQEANRETSMREAFRGGRDGADREARRERMETLRKDAEAKMLAHLTAEQQTQFTAMKGEPFEMPAFGGGRPGGPFGGPGEGRLRGGRRGGEGGGENRPARPE